MESRLVWNDVRCATRRERHYMALLAWRRYRPLRDRLDRLYRDFVEESPGACGRFAVRATWRGLLFEPCDLDQLWEETDVGAMNVALTELRLELEAFGRYLRRRVAI